jgi:hypothetical protein
MSRAQGDTRDVVVGRRGVLAEHLHLQCGAVEAARGDLVVGDGLDDVVDVARLCACV